MMQEFSLGKKLGNGCFGCVYEGINNKTGEKVAVKVINKNFISPELSNSLWREFDCMERCKCENSVRLFKKEDYPNEIHLIMELCDSDLQHHFKDNHNGVPFSEEEIRETFLQLNNGFKVMRKNNIIHRDLKIENIMIKYTDNEKKHFIPKISDYGLGKVVGNTFNTNIQSDPRYMAPELVNNIFYDEKVDLWSVGCMIYELFFRDLYCNNYFPGKIKYLFNNNNNNNRTSNDPYFKDLLTRLLEENPRNRISWNEYFNHPFFVGNNVKERYEKISDFDFGFNCDKDKLHCYIAQDNKYNMKVLIKSYKIDFITIYRRILDNEINLFIGFIGNNNVLKYLKYFEENGRLNLVFEYKEFTPLNNYIKDKKMTEKEIRKFNKNLYENVFKYIESFCMLPFNFISIYSFGIDKNDNPLIIDFGFHQYLIPYEEFSSYYLSNLSENTIISYKTNVLNYGVTLLKLSCGNNIEMKNKEIVLPQNINLSNKFKNFIANCVYRDINKRYSWNSIGNDEFVLDNNVEISKIMGKNVLLDNDKLDNIFTSLKNKFEFIINYYQKLDIKSNMEYIQQIEIFIIVTLFEMKIALNFFDRNIYEKPFTNQHEISFISINDNCELKSFRLNLKNPLLDDVKIIDMINNKLIKQFVSDLKENTKKIEELSKKIHGYSKTKINYSNFKLFFKQLLDNINNELMQEYFFSLIFKSFDKKNKVDEYNELCLAEYLCEFFLFFKAFIYDKEEKFNFEKNSMLEKFHEIFGENNNIEISVIKIKEVKNNYVLVSFLSTLLKTYKNKEIMSNKESKMNTQSLNGINRYYPELMKKIVNLKNE